jgi:hypothetical protein
MKKRYSIYYSFFTLVGIFGAIWTFIGVSFPMSFPWITFKSDHFLLPRYIPGEVYWEWVYYELSPFLLKYSSETGISVSTWMYRINMVLVGLICFIGIVVSVISLMYRKPKITILGGGLIILSMIFFGISLPGVYPNFSWGLGAKYTFYGALIIIISAIANITIDIDIKNREMKNKLIDFWGNSENKTDDYIRYFSNHLSLCLIHSLR